MQPANLHKIFSRLKARAVRAFVGERSFSKSWDLRASVSFSPLLLSRHSFCLWSLSNFLDELARKSLLPRLIYPGIVILWFLGILKIAKLSACVVIESVNSVNISVPKSLGNGKYAYLEASRPRQHGDNVRLLSPITQGPKCMSFMYHMYGSSMGSLVIYMKTNSSETVEWIKTGNHPNQWLEAVIFLNSSAHYQVIHLTDELRRRAIT